jgi:cell division protein FtsB
MMTRTRRRTIFQTIVLHLGAAALIGYFAVQGYNGQYGLIAKRSFAQQHTALSEELDALRAQREAMETKVSLLDPSRIDADILDEEGRLLLNLVNPKDLVMLRQGHSSGRLR